jgi:hypothetical protein
MAKAQSTCPSIPSLLQQVAWMVQLMGLGHEINIFQQKWVVLDVLIFWIIKKEL